MNFSRKGSWRLLSLIWSGSFCVAPLTALFKVNMELKSTLFTLLIHFPALIMCHSSKRSLSLKSFIKIKSAQQSLLFLPQTIMKLASKMGCTCCFYVDFRWMSNIESCMTTEIVFVWNRSDRRLKSREEKSSANGSSAKTKSKCFEYCNKIPSHSRTKHHPLILEVFLPLNMAFVLPFLLLLSLSIQTGAQRVSSDLRSQPVRVVISDTCTQDGAREREMDLDPDSPLVLTHRIRLLPGSGSGCGQCEVDFAALRERIERLEKEVSDLRQKCGGPDGCCTSQQSKGKALPECHQSRPSQALINFS